MKKKIVIGSGLVLIVATIAIVFSILQKDSANEGTENLVPSESTETVLLVPDDEQGQEQVKETVSAEKEETMTIEINGRKIQITDYVYDPTKPLIGGEKNNSSSSTSDKATVGESLKGENYKERGANDGMFDGLLNNINFNYAVRDTGFSRGFALNPKGKYSPGLIGGTHLNAYGPNSTEIRLEELDYTEGDINYWHTHLFHNLGFMQFNISKPEGSIPYGTKFTEGVGLANYEEVLGPTIIMVGEGDVTIDGNYQLLSDDKISCKFGEGYLVEYYEIDTYRYFGLAAIENKDGRIIYIRAVTPYYPTLKDIIMEFADTCVHLY